jgi:hypothetical protein
MVFRNVGILPQHKHGVTNQKKTNIHRHENLKSRKRALSLKE